MMKLKLIMETNANMREGILKNDTPLAIVKHYQSDADANIKIA